MLPLKFVDKNFSFEGARHEKALKFQNQYLNFEYFPKLSSEMNFTHKKINVWIYVNIGRIRIVSFFVRKVRIRFRVNITRKHNPALMEEM